LPRLGVVRENLISLPLDRNKKAPWDRENEGTEAEGMRKKKEGSHLDIDTYEKGKENHKEGNTRCRNRNLNRPAKSWPRKARREVTMSDEVK